MRRTTKTVLWHLFMAGGAVSGMAAWHWQLRWGATAAEQRRALPGDAVVSAPSLQATRAVGIAAPPREVWRWVARIGLDRAGFCGCDHPQPAAGEAGGIEPELRQLEVGDTVKLAHGMSLRVAEATPDSALVLTNDTAAAPAGVMADFSFSWAFALEPEGPTGTRLVVRERYAWSKWRTGLGVKAVNWVGFLVSRKMLAGIRDQAEKSWQDQVAARLEDSWPRLSGPAATVPPAAPAAPAPDAPGGPPPPNQPDAAPAASRPVADAAGADPADQADPAGGAAPGGRGGWGRGGRHRAAAESQGVT
ncbi:MAG: hypothetical protein LBD51_06575, partial [Bifidobacteriaceae bacterium]|nr:hypothetical protein [Bifidobacteriaceae bacterium]